MHIPVKRWRGYHRALKRGEPWAIKFSKMSPLNQVFTWVYRDYMFEKLLYSKNPILDSIPKDSSWSSGKYYQPVILGLEHGVTFADTKEDKDEPIK